MFQGLVVNRFFKTFYPMSPTQNRFSSHDPSCNSAIDDLKSQMLIRESYRSISDANSGRSTIGHIPNGFLINKRWFEKQLQLFHTTCIDQNSSQQVHIDAFSCSKQLLAHSCRVNKLFWDTVGNFFLVRVSQRRSVPKRLVQIARMMDPAQSWQGCPVFRFVCGSKPR